MYKYILYLIIITTGFGCQKDEIPFNDVFECLVNQQFRGCQYIKMARVFPHQNDSTGWLILEGDSDKNGIGGDMGIKINGYSGPGTYVLDENDEIFVWIGSDVYAAGGCLVCQDVKGSGKVIITSDKNEIIEGTFEGIVINEYMPSSKTISEGNFK